MKVIKMSSAAVLQLYDGALRVMVKSVRSNENCCIVDTIIGVLPKTVH